MFKFIFVLIVIGFGFTNCGEQFEEGELHLESRSDDLTSDVSSNGLLVICNTFTEAGVGFDALIYPRFENNEYSKTDIDLEIKNLNTGFAQNTFYSQFLKQRANGANLETDNTPLEFVFVYKTSKQEIYLDGPITELSYQVMQDVLNKTGFFRFANHYNFFDHFIIRLINLPNQYESFLVETYRTNSVNISGSTIALIPGFEASPLIYAPVSYTHLTLPTICSV